MFFFFFKCKYILFLQKLHNQLPKCVISWFKQCITTDSIRLKNHTGNKQQNLAPLLENGAHLRDNTSDISRLMCVPLEASYENVCSVTKL